MKHLLALVSFAFILTATLGCETFPTGVTTSDPTISFHSSPEDHGQGNPSAAEQSGKDSPGPASGEGSGNGSSGDSARESGSTAPSPAGAGSSSEPKPSEPAPEKLEAFYHQIWQIIGRTYIDPQALSNWSDWKDRYGGKLKTNDDLDRALEALASGLDVYTHYVSRSRMAELAEEERSGVVDLGMSLQANGEGAYVLRLLFHGSPAHRADLREGDEIVSIGGTKLAGLSRKQVEALMRGGLGTKVSVVYRHDGAEGSVELVFAVTPELKDECCLLPGKIIHARLRSFDAIADFKKAIGEAAAAGKGDIGGLVLDLRGNTGGTFGAAIETASMFLETGTVVIATTRNGRQFQRETYQVVPELPHVASSKQPGEQELDRLLKKVPLVVLTDGSTASASEIVVGALKDNSRAKIVGQTTFGKAVGYQNWRLRNGGFLQLTVLSYLTPGGTDLHQGGIKPDVPVEQPRGSKKDEQLERALLGLKELAGFQNRK